MTDKIEAVLFGVVFPESRELILELYRRGYCLGLVSDITNSAEVSALLKEWEIGGCFEIVIRSSSAGKQKTNSQILLDATQQMGIAPERCVYISNLTDQDRAAALQAGFAKVIVVADPHQPKENSIGASNLAPDHLIENLNELLDLFPPLTQPKSGDVYDTSFSTMWAIKTVPTLADFFEFAQRKGFTRIELNHKVTSAMLHGIDLNRLQISSVHEPAPADISADELKKRDWLVSSTNEDCRLEGVKAIQRSIDLAARLGAPAIVVHAGHVTLDGTLEKKLRALVELGRRDSEEYREIRQQMIEFRSSSADGAFVSVKKSVLELLAYAEKFQIRLGIENRYHYMEFPSPTELEILLGLAEPNRIGFIYDVGHGYVLDHLGFYAQETWLRRFGMRIIGTHLHDVVGTTDHYAPGFGEVDFDMVARYLPAEAFRTCEFQTFNTPEQVEAGLKFLLEHGCIKSLTQKDH